MSELAMRYKNVIVDNSQGFFAKEITKCMNVYSTRKFVGVPDGAYLLGKDATKYVDEYQLDYSSDTSLFLLQRIEYGCEGRSYESRVRNEERLDNSDIKRMSKLTHTILDGIDYKFIIKKRRDNFNIARSLFDSMNRLSIDNLCDEACVPMVYPLVIEQKGLIDILIKEKMYQGRWWDYLLKDMKEDTFEYYLSNFMIPITIDQRYGEEELYYMYQIITKELDK